LNSKTADYSYHAITVPTNAYPTSVPSSYIVIGANGDSIYNRLMTAIERTDLVGPEYETNRHRVMHQGVIEKAISDWTSQHTPEEVSDVMEVAKVPCGKIMNVKDLVGCEHLIERGMIDEVFVEDVDRKSGSAGWKVKVASVAPKLEGSSLRTSSAGPNLGAHNTDILSGRLGLGEEELNELRKEGVIS
jgi:crotonobetainyl-CoA:carnitine CoA-transferase CaiB-like acyl-CoA transferase